MTPSEWTSIKYFTATEAWGDSTKMDYTLISNLDNYRGFINCPIIVDCGTQGQHVESSNHYTGNAVDIKITGMNVVDAFIASIRFPFTGHGLYQWGLHLEYVPSQAALPKKLWMGIVDGSSQQYIGLTWENLGTYFGNFKNTLQD